MDSHLPTDRLAALALDNTRVRHGASAASDPSGPRLATGASDTSLKGMVYLVGAGPGDAELLTVKAHRLIREADAIVYDYLVGPDILGLARPNVERVFV